MGTKSHAALSLDWLNHFKNNSIKQGRPDGEGWLSCREMADAAGVTVNIMHKYLKKHEADYETCEGTIQEGSRSHTCRYFRFKAISKVRQLAKSGQR